MTSAIEAILDADVLMDRAAASARLDDFGDPGFIEPLKEYLAGAARYFPFPETLAARFADMIVNELVNRLRLNEDLKRHPEILDEDVSDPILVTGLPRTGTTKLQRVLSADPANQPLSYWKVLNFARFPDAVPGEPDPRIAVAKAACDRLAAETPELLKAHPFLHNQPEEDCLLIGANYDHFQNSGMVSEERFCAYVRSCPRDSAYRYLRTILKYLQWQEGGKRGPWILKSPVHIGYLPEVVAIFPNATIAQCHRDAATAFASQCRLRCLWEQMTTGRLDPHQTARDQLRVWGLEWDRNQADRAALPPDSRFIDIDYVEIKDDAISVAERIYALAGRRLADAGKDAIEQWETEHRKDRFGKLDYRLEDYGLSPEQVGERFRLRTPLRRTEIRSMATAPSC